MLEAATGKKTLHQISLRSNKTFFKARVDTDSLFMNRRTADSLDSVPLAFILDEKKSPIDTVYVDYNWRRIEVFGTLVVDVSSLGWQEKAASSWYRRAALDVYSV